MKLKLLATFIILFTASTAAFNLGGLFQDDTGQAALVKLSGTITPSSSGFGSTGITPESVREVNQKVRNGGYDAVIYEINSGGGAVVASKDVKRSIENMDIPTVCRFRDISASGAYLIAMGCDRIVADSATITGSVGVTSSYLEFSGTLDKLGIQYINVTAGKYKEVGSQYMNASERDKQMLKEMATDIQDEFIGIVRENRNLTQEEVQEIETASIFLGEEAKNLSMVDSLGGRAQAVDEAEELTGKDIELSEIQTGQDIGLLSLFLSETGIGNFFSELGLGANTGLPLTASY